MTFRAKVLVPAAFALFLASPAVLASGETQALASHWKTSKQYTLDIANQMPAEDYSFKPNPEEMSFGEQMAHIAQANAYFLSLLSDGKSPIDKPASYDKATVLALLTKSFDYSISAIERATPAQLSKTYKTPDGAMTGLGLIYFAMDHTTHHRAQCVVYLRCKNIKPAESRY
jgi:uncharacterized damage-inducible protein DinB